MGLGLEGASICVLALPFATSHVIFAITRVLLVCSSFQVSSNLNANITSSRVIDDLSYLIANFNSLYDSRKELRVMITLFLSLSFSLLPKFGSSMIIFKKSSKLASNDFA